MVPYLLILSIIIFYQYKYKINYKIVNKNENIIFILLYVVMFLFAALRGNGAGDYFTYKEYSSNINTINDVLDNSFPMEIGYRIIAFIVNVLNLNSQYVIIFMNFISITCTFIFIKKYSKNKLLSILIFFPFYLQFDMHAARTAVAMSIGIYSIKYVMENNFIKYFFIIFIASCFHKSALILIILYFFRNIKVSIPTFFIIILFLLLITSYINIDFIVNNILNQIGLNKLANRYYLYTDTIYSYDFKLFDPRLILNIITYVIAKNTFKLNRKEDLIFCNCIMISIFLTIIFRENTFFVQRISNYFSVFNIVLVPNIIYNIHKENKMIFNNVYVFVYILLSIGLIVNQVQYKLFFMS